LVPPPPNFVSSKISSKDFKFIHFSNGGNFFFWRKKFWRKILEEILEENLFENFLPNIPPNISSIFSSIWRYFWRKILDEKQNPPTFSSKFSSKWRKYWRKCWMKSWMYFNYKGGKSGGNRGVVGWAACGRWASISPHADTRALCKNWKVAC